MESQGDLVSHPTGLTAGQLNGLLSDLGWPGIELAERCGVNANTVSKWRKGKLAVPRYAQEIVRLAMVLRYGGEKAQKGG